MMMQEYKETPIGRIPKEWEIVRLKDVADYINGYAFSSKDWKSEGLPIIRIQNLNDPNADFNYFDEEIDDKYVIENGDLLFSWSGSIGVYVWHRGKAVLNQHIFKVVPEENVENLFLFHALLLAIKQLKSRVHGSTMKHFKRSELNTLIPLPPLQEQRRIVSILGTVDEAIERADEAIAKTKRLKKGLMQELLTKGIGHEEFKDTEIGTIPREWKVAKFKDILTECYRYPTYYGIDYVDRGVPEIRGELLLEDGQIEEDPEKLRYVERKTAEMFPRTRVMEGDLVLSVRGTIGKVGYVPRKLEGSVITANLMRLSPDKRSANPRFLMYYSLSGKFKHLLDILSPYTTIKTIQASILKSISIPLPSLSEQQKISEILSTVDEKLELESRRKEKFEKIKRGLMHELLTGRRRVKVDEGDVIGREETGRESDY